MVSALIAVRLAIGMRSATNVLPCRVRKSGLLIWNHQRKRLFFALALTAKLACNAGVENEPFRKSGIKINYSFRIAVPMFEKISFASEEL